MLHSGVFGFALAEARSTFWETRIIPAPAEFFSCSGDSEEYNGVNVIGLASFSLSRSSQVEVAERAVGRMEHV